jgi:hypothetical protein
VGVSVRGAISSLEITVAELNKIRPVPRKPPRMFISLKEAINAFLNAAKNSILII